LYLSILTLGEYDKGIFNLADGDPHRSRHIATRDALAARFRGRVLPLADRVVRRWGAISGRIKRDAGHRPPAIDTFFAATAIEADLYLVSRNIRDLHRSGAALFDPWTDDLANFPLNPASRRPVWPEPRGESMSMTPVESSMMRSVEYNAGAKTLDIAFSSGKTYRYFDVPASVYKGLLKAESKGQFFNERIKDEFSFVQTRSRTRL